MLSDLALANSLGDEMTKGLKTDDAVQLGNAAN